MLILSSKSQKFQYFSKISIKISRETPNKTLTCETSIKTKGKLHNPKIQQHRLNIPIPKGKNRAKG